MKRKSDEQRANDWIISRGPHLGLGSIKPAYLSALRSERRALKREQAETLRRLLDVGTSAHLPMVQAKLEGIRACIKALGFSEKGGVK